MIRPQRMPSPLTRGDRTRFHQLHWAKLVVSPRRFGQTIGVAIGALGIWLLAMPV